MRGGHNSFSLIVYHIKWLLILHADGNRHGTVGRSYLNVSGITFSNTIHYQTNQYNKSNKPQ